MTWTFALWAILVGGPLLGILATIALAVFHEHGEPGARAGSTLPGADVDLQAVAPRVIRRASTALLEDYLLDDREASISLRRRRHALLVLQTERASTAAFEDFMADLEAPAALPVSVPQPARRAPVRTPVRVAVDRAPRPTRLVPLSPEIAIG